MPDNLLKSIRHLGSFDVIFCRNVLIYFEPQTKTDVLGRLSDLLSSDGTLFLGGAETVLGVSEAFAPRPGHRGLYAPKNKIMPAVAA
jgi:chemotaxis protein methyltransferase CheR